MDASSRQAMRRTETVLGHIFGVVMQHLIAARRDELRTCRPKHPRVLNRIDRGTCPSRAQSRRGDRIFIMIARLGWKVMSLKLERAAL